MEEQATTIAVPANISAEEAVLGSVLINPDAIGQVAGKLKEDDFYRERHAWLWKGMLALHGRREPIDFVTLVAELESLHLLNDLGGPAFITELISRVPTALYLEHYAKIVLDMSGRRRLISSLNRIAQMAYDLSTPLPTVLDKAESEVFAVSSRYQTREVQPIRDVLTRYFENFDLALQGRNVGVPTGFTLLDQMLGGMQRSDLLILAGRPGMGKTGFALSVLNAAAQTVNARCLVFTIEMSSEQMVQRLLSMNTGIDNHRLRMADVTEAEGQSMMVAANTLANTQIFIDDTPAIPLAELRSKARRIHAEYGLDLILVDYLQLIVGSDGRMTREQEISYVSRSLKALARELDVPVLVLAQLSRAVESRQDKKPMLSDLRESGAVEQDADVVLFIYREDYYEQDSARQNVADILLAKHRHGATGEVSVYFRKELTQFRDLEINREDFEPEQHYTER